MRRPRVYELAKQHGIPARQVLSILARAGHPATSAASRLDEDATTALLGELAQLTDADIEELRTRDEREQRARAAEVDEWARQDRLMDTETAARLAGVTPATIRKWVQRGKLVSGGTRTYRNGRSVPLFDSLDVAKAEYSTAHGARRRVIDPASEPVQRAMNRILDAIRVLRAHGYDETAIRDVFNRAYRGSFLCDRPQPPAEGAGATTASDDAIS